MRNKEFQTRTKRLQKAKYSAKIKVASINATQTFNAHQIKKKAVPDSQNSLLVKRPKLDQGFPSQMTIQAAFSQYVYASSSQGQRKKLQNLFSSNHQKFYALQNADPVEQVSNRKIAKFGNYDRYYEDRIQFPWKDPRIQLFKSVYFRDKQVLDVGCHCGIFTIQLFRKFLPKLCIGVDIDPVLITKAIKSIKSIRQNLCTRKVLLNTLIQEDEKQEDFKARQDNLIKFNMSQRKLGEINELVQQFSQLPLSYQYKGMRHQFQDVCDDVLKAMNFSEISKFLQKLMFRQQNWVAFPNTMEKFDTILCLSLSKWIHLNIGDIGIEVLFYKAYQSLREGGYFILQPQQFSRYKKKKNLSAEINKNYNEIKLKPQQFEDYLVNEVGFVLIQTLTPPKGSVTATFQRPVLVFQKPQ